VQNKSVIVLVKVYRSFGNNAHLDIYIIGAFNYYRAIDAFLADFEGT
jgi:hypothetical protein